MYIKFDKSFSIADELLKRGFIIEPVTEDGSCIARDPMSSIRVGFNFDMDTSYDVILWQMFIHKEGAQIYSGVQPLNKRDFDLLFAYLFPDKQLSKKLRHAKNITKRD